MRVVRITSASLIFTASNAQCVLVFLLLSFAIYSAVVGEILTQDNGPDRYERERRYDQLYLLALACLGRHTHNDALTLPQVVLESYLVARVAIAQCIYSTCVHVQNEGYTIEIQYVYM